MGELDLPWNGGLHRGPKSIAVAGGYVYLSMNGTCGLGCRAYGKKLGLLVVDYTTVTQPGSVAGAWLLDQPSSPFLVRACDGAAAVSDDTQTIHLIETRSPTMPQFRGAIEMDYIGSRLASEGDHLVVADNLRGWLYKVRDPSKPQLLDEFTLVDMRAVGIESGMVYAVGRDREVPDRGRLVAWEITAEESLRRRGELVLGSWPLFVSSMAIHNGTAYLVDARGSLLWLIDVRDPTNMTVASRLSIPRRAMGVAAADTHAYVVCCSRRQAVVQAHRMRPCTADSRLSMRPIRRTRR